MPRYQHLAALGSSFAAGPGIEPQVDRAAGRSARNYAGLLANALGARLTDLSVSGATTATILHEPQRAGVRRFAPQVDGLPAEADLVTVTAGGNDLGYVGAMIRLAWAAWLEQHRLSAPLGRRLARSGPPRPTPADAEACATGLVRVVDAVRERAPQARVVLVDYLTLLSDDTRPGRDVPFDGDTLDALRSVGGTLEGAFAAAAERSGADLVPVSGLSRGHAVGSADPWVTGFSARPSRSAVPFHPDAAGMAAVARAVEEAL